MNPLRPRLLTPIEQMLPEGGQRIRRVLGRPTSGARISASIDLEPESSGLGYTAAYVDATGDTPVQTCDGTTAIHILWTVAGSRPIVAVGADPEEDDGLRQFEVHPGDTITIPPEVPFSIGAGILGFVFASGRLVRHDNWQPQSDVSVGVLPPTHGLQLFDGFNRRTICAARKNLLLERWKITQPLTLNLAPDRWHFLTNLVAPVALNWAGGSERLDRTASRLLPPGLDRVTIVPDGLGYILLGYAPDLEQDALVPLQRAGYDAETIGALGIPPERPG